MTTNSRRTRKLCDALESPLRLRLFQYAEGPQQLKRVFCKLLRNKRILKLDHRNDLHWRAGLGRRCDLIRDSVQQVVTRSAERTLRSTPGR